MGKSFIIRRADGSRYRQTRVSGGGFRNENISNSSSSSNSSRGQTGNSHTRTIRRHTSRVPINNPSAPREWKVNGRWTRTNPNNGGGSNNNNNNIQKPKPKNNLINEKLKLYNNEILKAKKGIKPDVVGLMRKGVINGDQATLIVNQYEKSPTFLKIMSKNDFSKLNKNSKVITGTLTKAKTGSITGEINKILTPSKTDSQFVRGLKGTGKFSTDIVTGAVDAGKLFTGLLLKDPAAIKKVKNGIVALTKPSTYSDFGYNLGKQISSNDPYLKTQGLLTIGSLIGGPKLKVNKEINLVGGETKYKVIHNLNNKKTNIRIEQKGIDYQNNNVKITQNLNQNPKNGDIKGNIQININGKITNKKINLKNKNGYYQDINTGEKINKNIKIPNKIKLDLTEIKTTQNGKDTILIQGNKIYKKGSRNIQKKRIQQEIKKIGETKLGNKKYNKITKTTLKETNIDYINNLQKKGGKIKPAIDILKTFERNNKSGKTILTKKGKTKTNISLEIKQFYKKKGITDKKIKDFLNSIDYDKKLINGLDRRTRLAQALQLNKNSSHFKIFEMYIKDGIGVKIDRKGKIIYSGKDKIIGESKFNFGLSSKTKKITKSELEKKLNLEKDISLPEIKIKIKEIKKIKGLGLISNKDYTDILRKLNMKKSKQETKQKTKQKSKSKQETKHKTKQKSKSKQETKQKTKQKTIIKVKNKIPIKPKLKVKTENKIKFKKFNFDHSHLNNKILSFIGQYRERKYKTKPASKNNPVITKTIRFKTTKNRALKKVATIVDNNLARSLYLRVIGIEKAQKDIKKPSLIKFRLKKSKNTPVLQIVEKSKYNFDTKGEKLELKKQKASKYTKNTKKSSKTKQKPTKIKKKK